jgi:hypothetical protein
MEQIFNDICRERAAAGRGLFGLALWLGIDTVGGIVNEHMRLSVVRHNSIVQAALVTVGVLMIPLWGSFYVDGWNWHWYSFVFLGAVVFSAAFTYQLVAGTVRNRAYRFAVGLAVATAFVLTWMNWIVTLDANHLNVMYLGVVLIGLVGAAIARLRPAGMAFALGGMAIAQMLVPFIALVLWKTRPTAGGLNSVFIVLFAISALLFQRAARTQHLGSSVVSD